MADELPAVVAINGRDYVVTTLETSGGGDVATVRLLAIDGAAGWVWAQRRRDLGLEMPAGWPTGGGA